MIVGSKALGFWLGKDYGGDTDILTDEQVDRAGRVEAHNLSDLNNAEFMRYATNHFLKVGDRNWPVCSLLGLAIMRRSHMHRLRKWDRNMFLFKEAKWPRYRDSLTAEDKRLLKERTKLTKQEYKNPSLDKSNKDFFEDNVTKHFDHDSIHEFVAYGDRPMYERMKVDMAVARCEKALWDGLSQADKIKCVLEECYVIGLERWLVPAGLNNEPIMPARMAVLKATKKVCTTLCSGWFRDFAIDYYDDIVGSINTGKMILFMKEKLDVKIR